MNFEKFSLYGKSQDGIAFYANDISFDLGRENALNNLLKNCNKFKLGIMYEIAGIRFFLLRDATIEDEVILNSNLSEKIISFR